ncbi:mRNA-capping enzyme subunit beta [Candida viswanathii]|uniref:mRNA-capping enzyme subunit beta n=1 Tax=Candida viswanathii TaxID=5486 RepID=A0A367YBX4_9ASCO|nr:mRNA-capping enzyme subunit beta [Candida viswanathii]
MNVGSILNDDSPGSSNEKERSPEVTLATRPPMPSMPSVHERHSITNMLNDAPTEPAAPALKQPEPTSSADFRKPSISLLTSPSVAHKPPPPPAPQPQQALHLAGSSGQSSARSSPAVPKRNSIANIIDAGNEEISRESSKAEDIDRSDVLENEIVQVQSNEVRDEPPAPKVSESPVSEVQQPVKVKEEPKPTLLDDQDDDLTKIKKLKQSKKPRRYETPPIWAQRWIPPNKANQEQNGPIDNSNGSATRLSDRPVFDYTTTRSLDLECSITGVIPPSSLTRTIAEWIYANFANIEDKSKRYVELELKLGKIIDKRTGNRLDLSVVTECIYTDHSNTRFEMEVEEIAWKEIKKYFDELERLYQEDKREKQTTRKFNMLDSDNTDTFYQLGGKGEHLRKVRISKDNLLSPPRYTAIQKERIADLYIHNPQCMYDLRLSLSLETPVPEGNIETIMSKNQPMMTREKKRTTYTHAPTITQFDLTRVLIPRESKNKAGKKIIQHDIKYEVELEVDTLEIFSAIDKITSGVDNFRLEELVEVYLNNARVLNNRVNKIALS